MTKNFKSVPCPRKRRGEGQLRSNEGGEHKVRHRRHDRYQGSDVGFSPVLEEDIHESFEVQSQLLPMVGHQQKNDGAVRLYAKRVNLQPEIKNSSNISELIRESGEEGQLTSTAKEVVAKGKPQKSPTAKKQEPEGVQNRDIKQGRDSECRQEGFRWQEMQFAS